MMYRPPRHLEPNGNARHRSPHIHRGEDSSARDWPLLTLALTTLVICFITGGSSARTGLGVSLAELLSLPLMAFAFWRIRKGQRMARSRAALIAAAAIALLPLLQLLPLPESLWLLAPARASLREDLALFGIHDLSLRWSLAPEETERNFYLMLPALALFLVPLALRRKALPMLLWWPVGLALFTLLLAFVQLGMPQESFVNPFPEYEPSLSGVFANKNHQACALAIGLVLALARMIAVFQKPAAYPWKHAAQWLCVLLVAALVLVLPLVKSRAGLLVAMVACGALLMASGPLSPHRWKASRAARASALLAVAVLAVGIWGSFAWMQSEVETGKADDRWSTITATLRLGLDNAPFGSGFGSFVPMFEQATEGSLMRSGYINNAHNDYAQWWFEGGVPAIATLLLSLGVLIVSVRRLLQQPETSASRRTGIAAACALLVLLLHSTVDYPLRTPALMAMAGLLAGLVVATSLPAQAGSRTDPRTKSGTT